MRKGIRNVREKEWEPYGERGRKRKRNKNNCVVVVAVLYIFFLLQLHVGDSGPHQLSLSLRSEPHSVVVHVKVCVSY